MTAAFVVDTSVAMTWLFADESTPATAQLLHRLGSEAALVPAFWYIEVANAIAMAERRARITLAQSAAFISDLESLDIELDLEAPGRAFAHLLPMCRSHLLTSYDAIYLDLSLRRGLPLATLDDDLRKAAKKVGVSLLGR